MSGAKGSALAGALRADLLGWLPSRRGRASAEEVIRDAALPTEPTDVVRDVVRRTRLWRNEKADVARELVSHFREGLAAGGAPGELARAFGDPKRAAAMIRRAKLRSRPLWWRGLRRTRQVVLGAIAAVGLVYGALAVRFWTGAPSPKRDYLAELAAPIQSIPERERAWPRYREAIIELEGIDPTKPAFEEITKGDRKIIVSRAGPATVQSLRTHPERRKPFLRARASAIESIRRATDLPSLGYVPSTRLHVEDQAIFGPPELSTTGNPDSAQLVGVLLPYLLELRELSQLLDWDAAFALESGDGARAVDDLRSMVHMASQLREVPTLIGEIFGANIVHVASESTLHHIAAHGSAFTSEQLRELARGFSDVRLTGRFETWWAGERACFEDIVQRVYTDDGGGDGHLTDAGLGMLHSIGIPSLWSPSAGPDLLLGPVRMALGDSRRQTIRRYERLESLVRTEAALPLWLRRGLCEQEAERMRQSPLTVVLAAEIVPAVTHAMAGIEISEMRRDAALVAIALELRRRETGAWPPTLDELVPSLLPAIPPDRFDGAPMRYRLVDGAPLLYSVGADRIDDGGEMARTPDGERTDGFTSQWVTAAQAAERVARLKEAAGRPNPGITSDTPFRGDWILFPVPPEPATPAAADDETGRN